MADAQRVSVKERAREAVDAADVGREDLYAGLAAIGGVEVDVTGSTARAVVTIPVPASGIRERLERGLRTTLLEINDVTDFEIEWRPSPADHGRRVDILPGVKNVVAVASGKGGVGKSTVAANIAVALADAGAAVGLLDADVYGPNAPTLLGLSAGSPETTIDARIVPREVHGVKVMSMDFVVDEDDPVIWRGPMVDDVLKQLTGDVEWGALDYLFVDMPPGTGDAQLTLVQHLPVAGAVIVTTPQPVAIDDARRGLKGFSRYDVPILGIVENMNHFKCPDCETVHAVFGKGGASTLADEFGIPLIGRLPIDPAVGELEDEVDPAGISLPLFGRIGLPRTRAEREGRLPPVAIRNDDLLRQAVREMATRTATRINEAAVDFEAYHNDA